MVKDTECASISEHHHIQFPAIVSQQGNISQGMVLPQSRSTQDDHFLYSVRDAPPHCLGEVISLLVRVTGDDRAVFLLQLLREGIEVAYYSSRLKAVSY
jgi:hypothetical protein